MVQRVSTVAFEGIEVRPVDVQVQVAPGMPAFTVVDRQCQMADCFGGSPPRGGASFAPNGAPPRPDLRKSLGPLAFQKSD